MTKISQELKKAHVTRQGSFAETTKDPQVGFQQGKEALSAIFMYLATRLLLLRVIDILMEVSFHRPIAAGRVGVEPTARVDGEVGRLLHCLHREIARRLEDDGPWRLTQAMIAGRSLS